MTQVVEDFCAGFELLDALAHAVIWREQHAAEHALLCFRRMRWQPIDSGVSGSELSPARPLQIGRTAGAFCNGIDHGEYKTGFQDQVLWGLVKCSSQVIHNYEF